MDGVKLKILNELAEEGNEGLTQKQLGERLDCSTSNISYHLTRNRSKDESDDKSLEAQNYVDVEKEGRKKFYHITEQGKNLSDVSKSSTAYPSDSLNNLNNEGGQGVPDKDVHNFSVKVGIANTELLNDDWRERLIEQSERNWEEKDGSVEEYVTYWKNTKVRLTGKNVIIRLEDRIHHVETVEAKNKAMDYILEAREWVEDVLYPVRLKDEMKIIRQHIAIGTEDEPCPLATFIDEETEMELKDFSVDDSNGVERIWMDRSDGVQTEAGNSPGSNREYAEDDVDKVDGFLRKLLEDEVDLEDFDMVHEMNQKDYQDRMNFMERAMEFLMMKEVKREKRNDRKREQKDRNESLKRESRLKTLEKRMEDRMERWDDEQEDE